MKKILLSKTVVTKLPLGSILPVFDLFRRNKQFLLQFFSGQLLLQLLNLLNGFFLLRWMSVEEQAKFSVAFSIQTFIISLSDLGFTGSIIALTGSRIHEKEVVGGYINSARKLRNIFLLFSLVASVIFVPFIVKQQSWGTGETALLLLPVILSVLWQVNCSLYNSPLVMHKRMKELYWPQVNISFLKIIANYLFTFFNIIGAFSVMVVNAISLLITGILFKKKSAPFITVNKNEDREATREMLDYLKPLFPSLVFNSFFGQIQIFLISFFGHSTNVAEVAALGKLNQLFVFLGSINAIVISPFIARSTERDLKKKFSLVLLFSLAIASAVYFSALLFPDTFLYLLGPKYNHLYTELPLAILSSCIAYVSGAIWTMNSARKWLFWWASILYILSVVFTQIFGIFYFDLSQTQGVFQLGLLTALVVLVVQLMISFVGFFRKII